MKVRIEKLTPEKAIDAYNCQKTTPEISEFKKQSAEFLGEKIRSDDWLAFSLYADEQAVGKAILIPTKSGMTFIEGDGAYFFHCINLQKAYRGEGYGREFLSSILQQMEKSGVKAVAVTCFSEYWMSFKFFNHMGFEKVSQNNLASLMVKKFTKDAQVTLKPKTPELPLSDDRIRVDIVYDLSCPFMTANYSKHKHVAETVSPRVEVMEHYIRMACDYSSVGDPGFYVEGVDITAGPVNSDIIVEKITEQLKLKGLLE